MPHPGRRASLGYSAINGAIPGNFELWIEVLLTVVLQLHWCYRISHHAPLSSTSNEHA